jgi:hypothetical protein
MGEMGVTYFRAFYDVVLQKEARPLYWYVLYPWVEAHPEHVAWLRGIAAQSAHAIPAATPNDLWELYALSRANDHLLLRFQRLRAHSSHYQGPTLTLDEYQRFVEALGFTVHFTDTYSPFYHEIVEVEQAADPDQPVTLLASNWPCLMLGNLLFSRAGVRVSAGRNVVCKEVAESSTLYWAHRRKNRDTRDRSDGWGSNSQWRTSFRRDYCIGNRLHYNIDGKYDLSQPDAVPRDEYDPPRAERIELLLNRCFVTTAATHDDFLPYEDRLTTPS